MQFLVEQYLNNSKTSINNKDIGITELCDVWLGFFNLGTFIFLVDMKQPCLVFFWLNMPKPAVVSLKYQNKQLIQGESGTLATKLV